MTNNNLTRRTVKGRAVCPLPSGVGRTILRGDTAGPSQQVRATASATPAAPSVFWNPGHVLELGLSFLFNPLHKHCVRACVCVCGFEIIPPKNKKGFHG